MQRRKLKKKSSSCSRWSESSFLRNVTAVATGNFGAQAIALMLMPVVTRLYGPEVFGLFSIFAAILTMLSPVAALSYPGAIVLPAREPEAIALARLSLRTALFVALVLQALLFLLAEPLLSLLGLVQLGNLVHLLPLAVLGTALMAIGNFRAIREQRFGFKARVTLIGSAVSNFGKVSIGLIAPLPAGLVVMHAANPYSQALCYWLDRKQRSITEEQVDMRVVALQYRDFPFFRMPESFLNQLSQSLPILALSVLFGSQMAGYYALARLAVGAPITMLSSAVGDVLVSRMAERVRQNQPLVPTLNSLVGLIALTGGVPLAILAIAGPALFDLVFGSEWSHSGIYATWLCLWLVSAFATVPCTQLLIAMRRQQINLAMTFGKIALRLLAIGVAVLLGLGDVALVAIYSAAGTFSNVLFFVITRHMASHHDKQH